MFKYFKGNPGNKTMSMGPGNESLHLARIRVGVPALDAKPYYADPVGPVTCEKTRAVSLFCLPGRLIMFIISLMTTK